MSSAVAAGVSRLELVERRDVGAIRCSLRRPGLGAVAAVSASGALSGLVAEERAHRVRQVGELAQHSVEHLAQRVGHPLGGCHVDVAPDPFEGASEYRFDRTHDVAEHGEHVVVTDDRSPTRRLT